IWSDTDPDRTGMLGFVFEDGFGFERYADYMLDVPMYFLRRNGGYLDVAGKSFRKFMAGALDATPGEKPTLTDWKDHLSTAFPEVRLKTFLEMRGADGGPWSRICALPAFWVGLLYDAASLDGAWELSKDWAPAAREQLRHDAARLGLKAEIGGRTLQEIAIDVLELARGGLKRRAFLDTGGSNEAGFLEPLEEVARSGRTMAEVLLAEYEASGRDMRALYEAHAY
ncbi:MAG: glutamate-cysteine ligase family protein, partial [Pseudomonadota bacterium]